MLQNILQASPVGIGYFEHGKLVWSNQSMADIFGHDSQNDCKGMSPRDFYACEDEYTSGPGRPLRQSCPAAYWPRATRSSGEKTAVVFHGHVKISALDTSDICFGVIIIISDISERKQAEEALQLAYEQLEQHVEERTAELKLINAQLLSEIADAYTGRRRTQAG